MNILTKIWEWLKFVFDYKYWIRSSRDTYGKYYGDKENEKQS